MEASTTGDYITEYIYNYLRDMITGNEGYSLYSVVDAAVDHSIYPLLKSSAVRQKCLFKKGIHYSGRFLTRKLAAAAPHLLALSPEDPTLHTLIMNGWDKNWFSLLFSNCDFDTVAEHCSDNLLAKTPDGQTLLFRYYDPRILRCYLPTCTIDELSLFFGLPVKAFCCPSEISAEPLLFTMNSDSLLCQTASGEQRAIAPQTLNPDEEDAGNERSFQEYSDPYSDEVTATETGFNTKNYQVVTFADASASGAPKEIIKNARLNFGPDKYTIEDTSAIDCDNRKYLCKQKCCTLIFTLTEQDVREGIVRWDEHKPYTIRQNDKHYCVHLVGGKCSIYENRPGVCRKFDCRRDTRVWIDYEKMLPA